MVRPKCLRKSSGVIVGLLIQDRVIAWRQKLIVRVRIFLMPD